MITFRAGSIALIAVLATLAAGCSREQQDWRSAEAADTHEAYGRFVDQHPDSELGAQARARLAQLAEERDWTQAGILATADAYRAFLAQHPSGKWSEEARIRIEAFALGSAPRLAPPTRVQPGGAPQGPSGVRARGELREQYHHAVDIAPPFFAPPVCGTTTKITGSSSFTFASGTICPPRW